MLRWGILSVANINKRFLPPVLESPRSILVAVGSRSLDKAKEHAANWNIPKFYGSYEEVINDEDVNAVYIPLPNSMHVEWTLRAAARGLHCLVEKPMALDGDGVRQLQEASARHKVVIEEAFVHLHHPMLGLVRGEMGSIGQITHLRGLFQSNLTKLEEHLVWKPGLGSGAIWMLGCYPLSAIVFLLNRPPVSVCAQYRPHGNSDVDETLSAVLKFSDGVLATVTTSIAAHSSTELEIFGGDGQVRMRRNRCFHVGQAERNNEFEVETAGGGVRTVAAPDDEAFAMQLRRFEEAVLDGAAPAVSLELSAWIADTLAACVRSAKEERFVHL